MSAVRENCFASPELCLSLCLRDASGRLAYRRKLTIGACEVSLVTPSVVQRLGGQRLRSAGQQCHVSFEVSVSDSHRVL